MSAEWHVASLVVRCLPDRLEAVCAALRARPDTTVFAAREGRIVAVVEADDTAAIADHLVAVRALPGVLAADPVYHHAEDRTEVQREHDPT